MVFEFPTFKRANNKASQDTISPINMTLSFTAMSDKWRRVSGAKVQQIIDMGKEKGIYLSKNPFFLSILAFLKKWFFSRVPPCMSFFFCRLHLQGHNHLIILILNFLLSCVPAVASDQRSSASARRKKQRSIHPLQGLLFLFISLMQEKRNQRVHYPQGPLQRGMQPLRLSLLH